MSREQDNKAFVGRWFPPPTCCSSIRCMRRAVAREDVRNFMEGFRAAFPDLNFWGAADLIAEGDYVVGRWEGGGTHNCRALARNHTCGRRCMKGCATDGCSFAARQATS